MHEKLIVQAEKLAFSCSYGNVYGNLYMWTNVGSVEQREIPGAIVRETPNTVVKNHFFLLNLSAYQPGSSNSAVYRNTHFAMLSSLKLFGRTIWSSKSNLATSLF